MKNILVSQRIIENYSYHEIRECLDSNWGSFLSLCNINPIPILSSVPLLNYFSNFNIQGILLTGGNDLNTILASTVNQLRDSLETPLLKIAIQKNIPVIGVCRGAQFIANQFNATVEKIDNHVNTNHQIKLVSQSRLTKAFNNFTSVNSFHNYAITTVDPNKLNILFETNDGSIEAFEHIKLNIFGIMWHPERDPLMEENNLRLFKEIYS